MAPRTELVAAFLLPRTATELEVAVDVHSLMEDADDINITVVRDSVEHQMGSRRQLEIARPDLIACAADSRVRRGSFEDTLQQAQVMLGLVGAPLFFGVVPDVFKIGLSRRR